MDKDNELTDADTGAIALAARKLLIATVENHRDGQFQYDWVDFQTGTKIFGSLEKTKKEAYRKAALKLVNYLTIPNDTRNEPTGADAPKPAEAPKV